MSLDDVQMTRAMLFVPATRPERLPKAVASGADMVCLDLEDAVAPAQKDSARSAALALLATPPERAVVRAVRINGVRTAHGLRDLLALLEATHLPDALVLPMVDSPQEVAWVDGLLAAAGRALPLIALIETGRGLEAVQETAAASPRLAALAFGGADMVAELRMAMDWEALLYVRSRIVHAAGTARIGVLDVPYLDIPNLAGCREEAQRAKALGFTGKAAIHPTHIAPIQAVFTPDAETIARARKIVAAYAANTGGVLQVDGRMIDVPVVQSMQRIVRSAERHGL